jgi:hypothetical protein
LKAGSDLSSSTEELSASHKEAQQTLESTSYQPQGPSSFDYPSVESSQRRGSINLSLLSLSYQASPCSSASPEPSIVRPDANPKLFQTMLQELRSSAGAIDTYGAIEGDANFTIRPSDLQATSFVAPPIQSMGESPLMADHLMGYPSMRSDT